jgi:hypothetical protein
MLPSLHAMTDTENVTREPNPWEPPTAGTEVEHLLGALDRQRTTFRWKADGLDSAGLSAQVGASSLTIGSLLKHLAFVEAFSFRIKLRGESPGEPWESGPWDDGPGWVFTTAEDDTPEQLYGHWDTAVDRSRQNLAAALADGGLDQPVDVTSDSGERPSLRRMLFDLVEEYRRHTGHADLLRESVDGRTGEDPPDGWQPQSGTYSFGG